MIEQHPTPEFLYHGTSEDLLPKIEKSGLLPLCKRWPKLTVSYLGTQEHAEFIASKRALARTSKPLIFRIPFSALDTGKMVADFNMLTYFQPQAVLTSNDHAYFRRYLQSKPGQIREDVMERVLRKNPIPYMKRWKTTLERWDNVGSIGYRDSIPFELLEIVEITPGDRRLEGNSVFELDQPAVAA